MVGGDRGETVDEGWLRPFLLIWAAYLAVVAIVFAVGRMSRVLQPAGPGTEIRDSAD